MGLPAGTSTRVAVAAMLAAALIGTSLVIWHATYAAFSTTNSNGTNTWQSGTVVLDAATGNAPVSITNAVPNRPGQACVLVRYTGTVQAHVHVYVKAADLSGALAPYLILQLDEGTGTATDCSDFSAVTNDYNAGSADTTKTLTAFSAAAHDYTGNVGSWTATQNTTRMFRITWQVQDDDAAQGLSAQATFTWEANSF